MSSDRPDHPIPTDEVVGQSVQVTSSPPDEASFQSEADPAADPLDRFLLRSSHFGPDESAETIRGPNPENGRVSALKTRPLTVPQWESHLGSPQPFEFQPFDSERVKGNVGASRSAFEDVDVDLRIELGRTELRTEEVLQLKEGSVVPLDKLAGDPVDVLVNGRLIARGEVLVLNDKFCVRVAEILSE